MSSLVVNTNLSAIQTLNDLNSTNNSETTAISRLSSGLQIENAATGPAQYVVSQSLEAEANGYGSAIDNAQDGVSMIQTVSGALSQISSILQTMDQLALTSANGATETTTALQANQTEFADLTKSINEIAKTTTFGTTNLLVGTGSATTAWTGVLQVGAFDNTNQKITLSISAVTAKSLGLTGGAATVKGSAISTGTVTLAAAKQFKFSVGKTATHDVDSFSVTFAAGTYSLTQIATKVNQAAGDRVTASVQTHQLVMSTVETGTSAHIQVTKLVTFGFSTTPHKAGTGSATSISITTAASARAAVATVQSAISTVDKVASSVGATQNELNAIVSNLTVGQQNLQAADSQLVDVNMAQEMTTFSTDQILMQSGVSMLSQAQQLPSLVLKLMGA